MESKKLNVKLLSHTENPELVIATAGKLCYSPSTIEDLMEKQTDESVAKFVNMLVSMGHYSPLEHCSFTFAIEGVSRSLTHQLVRHRIASYSQQSQRYVNLEKSFNYITPKRIKDIKYVNDLFEKAMESSFDYYVTIARELLEFFIYDFLVGKKKLYSPDTHIEILEETMKEEYKSKYNSFVKMAIEDARSVLPNACETKIICTMNLRTLINFCKHRCCRRAQDEIHELAWEIVKLVEGVSPLLGKCLGASCQFGACPEGSYCCGNPYPKK